MSHIVNHIKRNKITDLNRIKYSREIAEAILKCIREECIKSKSHNKDGHKISIHINKETGMVNIDIEEEKDETLVYIPYTLAVTKYYNYR